MCWGSFFLLAFPRFRLFWFRGALYQRFLGFTQCSRVCLCATCLASLALCPRSGSAAPRRLGIPAGQRTPLPLLPALAPLQSLPFPVPWRDCEALGSIQKLLFSTLFNTCFFPVILSFHLSVFLKEKAKIAGWSWVHSNTWPHSNINHRWT